MFSKSSAAYASIYGKGYTFSEKFWNNRTCSFSTMFSDTWTVSGPYFSTYLQPSPSYRRFLTPLQQTTFWKHTDKRRNCSKRAISPFATMFSNFSRRLSIQLKRFSIFWKNMFKVFYCRIVVWGKGLTISHIQRPLLRLSSIHILKILWQMEKLLFMNKNLNYHNGFKSTQ